MISNETVRCLDETPNTLKFRKSSDCPPARWAKTEHQLRKAKLAAEENTRNYASFLANMSHELRTPLNAILGFSEILMLHDRNIDDEKQNLSTDGYARHIHTSGQHLLALINDILDISKLNAEKLELQEDEVLIDALFESAETMIRERANKAKIKFDIHLPEREVSLWADGRRLSQALLNLLSNAIKFTPDGGHVTLGAHLESSGKIIMTVIDTGVGMAMDDIPMALSEYGQVEHGLEQKHDSTGLGLPLSKRLIELHGGTLELESAPGEGTIASISIPKERVILNDT